MKNRQKYSLIQGNDSHWYLIPFDKKEEAENILTSITDYWENGEYDEECPEKPDWIKEIDGWHRLTFENPIEE